MNNFWKDLTFSYGVESETAVELYCMNQGVVRQILTIYHHSNDKVVKTFLCTKIEIKTEEFSEIYMYHYTVRVI